MESEPPAYAECTVSAPLGYLLLASRAAGLAPLTFDKVHSGWRIRVSRLFGVYGTAMFFTCVVLTAIAAWCDLTIDSRTSFEDKKTSQSITWLFDIYAVISVVKATPNIHRMRYLIDCIEQLRQINKKLEQINPSCSGADNKSLVYIICLIFEGLFVLSSSVSLMYKVVITDGKVVTSSLYIGYYLLQMSLLLLALQFAMVAAQLGRTLRRLNCCIKILLQDMHGNCYCQASASSTLRTLTQVFGALCDVKQAHDDADAPMLVALLSSIQIQLIVTTYNFFSELTEAKDLSNILGIVMQLPWALFHFGKLIILIEPAHRASEEMELTRRLVTQLRRQPRAAGAAVDAEIKLFCQHFSLYPLAYITRLEYDLTRALIVSILSSITLYLNILINLK